MSVMAFNFYGLDYINLTQFVNLTPCNLSTFFMKKNENRREMQKHKKDRGVILSRSQKRVWLFKDSKQQFSGTQAAY